MDTPAPAVKPIGQMLRDSLFTSVAASLIAGMSYWAAVQWVETYSPPFSEKTIVTETQYIVFTE